jgi:hypothetical protein
MGMTLMAMITAKAVIKVTQNLFLILDISLFTEQYLFNYHPTGVM